jgi:hypothetical protein
MAPRGLRRIGRRTAATMGAAIGSGAVGSRPPPLAPQTQALLARRYLGDIDALEAETGLDLTGWRRVRDAVAAPDMAGEQAP